MSRLTEAKNAVFRATYAKRQARKPKRDDDDDDLDGPTRQGNTIRAIKPPGRNALCPCGSKLKYKACCGKAKQQPIKQFEYKDIRSLYTGEQKMKAKEFLKRWGFHPDPVQLKVFIEGTEEEQIDMVCTLLITKGASPRLVACVRAAGCLLTHANKKLWPQEWIKEYNNIFVSDMEVVINREEITDDGGNVQSPTGGIPAGAAGGDAVAADEAPGDTAHSLPGGPVL